MREETPLSYDADCVLHFATRYAIGRMTTAPPIVCKELLRNWSRLSRNTQVMIHREIAQSIDRGVAGAECDVAEWRKVLARPVRAE
jgi:hypothetical protein